MLDKNDEVLIPCFNLVNNFIVRKIKINTLFNDHLNLLNL